MYFLYFLSSVYFAPVLRSLGKEDIASYRFSIVLAPDCVKRVVRKLRAAVAAVCDRRQNSLALTEGNEENEGTRVGSCNQSVFDHVRTPRRGYGWKPRKTDATVPSSAVTVT